jgi:hypothetical protein
MLTDIMEKVIEGKQQSAFPVGHNLISRRMSTQCRHAGRKPPCLCVVI